MNNEHNIWNFMNNEHNIWNRHVKCIQISAIMPGVGSLICKIDVNKSEMCCILTFIFVISTKAYLRNPSIPAGAAGSVAYTTDESKPLLEQISKELAAQVGEVLINESSMKLGDTIGQGNITRL